MVSHQLRQYDPGPTSLLKQQSALPLPPPLRPPPRHRNHMASCFPIFDDCCRCPPRGRLRFRIRGRSNHRLGGGPWFRSRRHLVEDAPFLSLGLQQGACRQGEGEKGLVPEGKGAAGRGEECLVVGKSKWPARPPSLHPTTKPPAFTLSHASPHLHFPVLLCM